MKPRSIKPFLDDKPPDITAIVEPNIIIPKSRTLVFGEAGIGKSMLIHNLAFCLAMGKPWIGLEIPKPVRVLYWQAEGSDRMFWERTFVLDQTYGCSLVPEGENLWLVHEMNARLNESDGRKLALENIAEAKPDVVIFDPLYKVMRGEDTDQLAGKALVDMLDALIQDVGCAVVMVHHSRKRLIADGRTINTGKGEARGHTTLTQDWPDVELQVRRTADGLVVVFEKCRYGEEPEDILVRLDRTTLLTSATSQTLAEAVVELIVTGGGSVVSKELQESVRKKFGVSKSTYEREIRKLKDGGLVRTAPNPARKNEVVVSLVGGRV